jgi:hypothetical protein
MLIYRPYSPGLAIVRFHDAKFAPVIDSRRGKQMNKAFVIFGVLAFAGLGSNANAYTFDGGVCPKDPKVQCGIKCDNGQTADYIKWTGSGWSDLVGRTKDADLNALARKLIANSNKMVALMGGKDMCK